MFYYKIVWQRTAVRQLLRAIGSEQAAISRLQFLRPASARELSARAAAPDRPAAADLLGELALDELCEPFEQRGALFGTEFREHLGLDALLDLLGFGDLPLAGHRHGDDSRATIVRREPPLRETSAFELVDRRHHRGLVEPHDL